MCGLKKIRGDVFKKMKEGHKGFFQDCELSTWSPEECSSVCAGGTHKLPGASWHTLALQKSLARNACHFRLRGIVTFIHAQSIVFLRHGVVGASAPPTVVVEPRIGYAMSKLQ